jgi:signal transduction histidine kinase
MTQREEQKNSKAQSSQSDSELVANLKKRIEELEQITEMFDQTSELSRLERLHAERLIKAHEELRNLTEKERREADAVIEAQQRVQELSTKERIDAERLLAAHEEVGRLAQRERKEAESVINAQENALQLSDNERRQAENFIAAKDQVEQLASDEVKRRDAVLAAVLSMNSQMHFAQLVGDFFTHTLNDIIVLFGASRGFMARSAASNMRIVVENGYPTSKNSEANGILGKLLAGEDVPGIFARIISDEHVSGFVYLERSPGNGKFEEVDKWFLEVITSQLAVGFSGILLREKYIRQNFELRKLTILKGNFIRNLSVDLQKPMEKIISLLEKKTDKGTGEALQDMTLLKKGVDKILSVFALQQEIDEMYTHAIMIDGLIQKVFVSYQEEIKKRKLTIEYNFCKELHSFSGNYDTIYTILDEVLCNAIVYNSAGGKVRVSIMQDDLQCKIVVRDTGVGVSKEMLPRIFERFYRAPTSGDLHDRGAGLGLYIVREFIEAYGGSITFTSEEGKGSEVTLIFPMWHIGAGSTIFS